MEIKPGIKYDNIYNYYKLTVLGSMLQLLHERIFELLIEEEKIGPYIEDVEIPTKHKYCLYDVNLCFPKETVLTFNYDQS
jgi:hypothetical protein